MTNFHKGENNYVPIFNISYDYIPSEMASEKVMWVSTQFPVKIPIGTIVRLMSQQPNFKIPDIAFQIKDIILDKIVLSPMIEAPSRANKRHYWPNNSPIWTPLDYANQWGYSTRMGFNGDRNYNYGIGKPICYLMF